MLLKYFSVLSLVAFCFGQSSEQNLLSSSAPQEKVAGESVELECVLQNVNASEYPISWLKETDDPLNLYKLLTRGSQMIPELRYAVAYVPSPNSDDVGVFKLQILNLTESDSGTYLCNVHLSDVWRLESKISLKVHPVAIDAKMVTAPVAERGDQTNSPDAGVENITIVSMAQRGQ